MQIRIIHVVFYVNYFISVPETELCKEGSKFQKRIIIEANQIKFETRNIRGKLDLSNVSNFSMRMNKRPLCYKYNKKIYIPDTIFKW